MHSTSAFFMVPYDSPDSHAQEIILDFYLPSACIAFECTFGDIDVCWGIFWNRICCTLDNSALIIEGIIQLHEFLIDYREDNNCESEAEVDMQLFETECDDRCTCLIVTGNDTRSEMGRP